MKIYIKIISSQAAIGLVPMAMGEKENTESSQGSGTAKLSSKTHRLSL